LKSAAIFGGRGDQTSIEAKENLRLITRHIHVLEMNSEIYRLKPSRNRHRSTAD